MDEGSSDSEAEFDFDKAEMAATVASLQPADIDAMAVDATSEYGNTTDGAAAASEPVDGAVITGTPPPASSRRLKARGGRNVS